MRYKILFFCCFIVLTGFAQNKTTIDSLEQRLLIEQSEVRKCSIYNDLVRNYIYSFPKTSLKFNDSLADLSRKIENKGLEMLSQFNYARIYRVLGDSKKALDILIDYNAYVEKKQDTTNLIPAYYQTGVSYMFLDDKVRAIEYLLRSLELSELTKNEEKSLQSLNAIGAIYDQMGQYQKALEYYKKVETAYEESQDPDDLGLIYSNLGIVYKHLDSLDIALEYFQKGYNLNKDRGNLSVKSYQLRNIGLIYQNQNKLEQAENYFLKSLQIREEMGEQLPLLGSYYDLGSLYDSKGNFIKSIDNLKKALEISREIHSESNEALCLLALSEVYEKYGNLNSAFKYLKEGRALNDSIQSVNFKEKVNDLDKKYQTEKKDKEIANQKLELKEQEAEIQKKKTQQNYMFGVIGFLLIASMLIWLVFKQRQKRKNQEFLTLKREYQIKSLEALIEGEEKERFRIAKELHDGVNGDLSAIKYKLSTLIEMNDKVIKEAISMIDDSCNQVRAISHNLVPPSLDKFSLIEAAETYCDSMNAANHVEINFQSVGTEVALPKKAEINIFRIIQELVSNSIKHANANEINVQVSFQQGDLQVTVEDDGIGFNKKEVKGKGIGLANVESRIQYLKAEFDFVSNDKGTSCTFEVDITKLDEY
ncbi:MAG: sensor histidine kinase [Winogradskyella sp.]|uniref:tetratricopeptide repeat-containing sensor histidine kinase n=1 Tax=Winogradskyella sp. TaxID=1883156 RepID=UPI0025CB7900|nr:sensor histidine kinase [Winogradskyella sp.]NRB61130.1 sensor histidine kinase [Winogradskyella sp.]